MDTVIYLLKVILCSAVMFAYYWLCLKDKTFHHYNRFYLLVMIVVSMILPLLKIEYFTVEFSDKVFVLLNKIQTFKDSKDTNDGINYLKYINWGIAGVAVILLLKLLIGIFKIFRFKNAFQKENFKGINFYQTNLSEAPFSYFKNLFWKNTIVLNSDIGKQILKHEMVHIEQKHSYDKIFIEIVTAIFWFNPFFHFIKKEINLIHEYLADNKAVRQSDTQAFAQMLLASHFSGNQLPATSPFLSSNLKKRLKMIQKPKTKYGYVRRLFALPVVFSVAFAYLVNAKNIEIEKVNNDAEKIINSLENRSEQNNDEVRITNAENLIAKDTTRPTNSQTSEGEIVSNLQISGTEANPLDKFLVDADDQDIFLVEGQKVSKSEFKIFLEKNRETPNFVFSHSARKTDAIKIMIYSAAKNNDKVSSAIRNKMMKENNLGNDMFMYMTKIIVSDDERENLRQSLLEKIKARKAAEEAEQNGKNTLNDNRQFFKNSEQRRTGAIEANEELKKELQKAIIAKNEASKLRNNFKKGRNYDKNPLTKEEVSELKKEAEEIEAITENHYRKSGRISDFALFKADKQSTKVYDIEGNEIVLPEAPFVVNTKMIGMSTSGADLYIDGKKVSKEEFLKYQTKFKDGDSESKIKEFKVERIGDGKYSYAKKMEIITK